MGWLDQARRDARRLAELPPAELLAVAWRLLRPAAWVPTFFSVYLGYAFASRELVPAQRVWTAYVRRGLADGFDLAGLAATLTRWLAIPEVQDLVYASIVLGPLIWGGTLLYNDVHDLESDRRKPLRRDSPLVLGYISKRTALVIVYVVSALGMVLSWLVSPTFFALMAAALTLSWAYSSPRIRLKGRAGFDVAVNVVGVGALCFVGGWSIARPLAEFPPLLFALMALYLTGGYIPTTIADHHLDLAAGDRTIAVALGPRRAFHVGLAALIGGDLAFVAWILLEQVVAPAFLLWAAPLFVLKNVAYAIGVGEVDALPRIWSGLALFSALVAALIVAFLLAYTGFWTV